MTQLEEMQAVLSQEETLFQRFYEEAAQMLTCPAEEMEAHMEQRLQLKDEIDLLEEAKNGLFAADPALSAAIQGSDPISPVYQQLRDTAFRIRGILYQVQQLEPKIIKRALQERSLMEDKIRAGNKSTAAQASRFMVGTTGASTLDVKIGKA